MTVERVGPAAGLSSERMAPVASAARVQGQSLPQSGEDKRRRAPPEEASGDTSKEAPEDSSEESSDGPGGEPGDQPGDERYSAGVISTKNFELKSGESDEACQAACTGDNKCRAWTFARAGYVGREAHCFLKKEIKPPRRKAGFTSGVVR